MPYNLYPAIDENYNFPPVVRQALADSAELDAAFINTDELFINVLDKGVIGDGDTDERNAVQDIVDSIASIGGEIYFPPGKTYKIFGSVDLSLIAKPVTINIPKGAVVVEYSDAPVFKTEGLLGASVLLTSNATAGNRTCTMATTTAFPVGSYVYLASSNTIPGSTDKLAYIRQVKGATATVLTLDKALPRSLFTAQTAHARPVTLTSQVAFIGGGQVKHVDSSNSNTLIDLILTSKPVVKLELGPSGGPGVTLSHCIGGLVDSDIHDLEDDDTTGHFGYGVSVAGTSRDITVLGSGTRCRHAFTTNVGPNITNSAYYGEPENILVHMVTQDCSNKALDTHRAGYGIIFLLANSGGSSGSLQIRADNTIVIGGSGSGSNSVGISVASEVVVPARISGVSITDVAGSGGVGFYLAGPAIVSDCSVRRFTSKGFDILADGCVLSNIHVDAVTPGTLVGIDVQANNTTITGATLLNCATPYRETAGKTGNVFVRPADTFITSIGQTNLANLGATK